MSGPAAAHPAPAGADPGRPRPHDVFVSYANRDSATADAVCAALEAGGIRCWIAPRDVPVGLPWKASIVDAIRASRAVVLIFSGEANGSPQVQREVDIAFEARPPIPVFPFRIADVEIGPELYYCIGARHWLDALTPPLEAHTARLVLALREAGYATGPDPAAGAGGAPADGASHDAASPNDPPPDAAWPNDTPAGGAPPAEAPPPDPGSGSAPGGPPGDRPATGGRSRGVLAAAALFLTGLVALGVFTLRGGRRAGAVPARRATPEVATTPAPEAGRPAPAPARPTDTQATPHDSGPRRTGHAARGAPVTAVAAAAVAPVNTGAIRRAGPPPEERAHPESTRAAPRAPDSLLVACARLLERESLGETLSGQEAARRERDCRRAPR